MVTDDQAEHISDWPDHWEPWVTQSFDCLNEAEKLASEFIPDNAPLWAHDMLASLVQMSFPKWNLRTLNQTGPQALGAFAGHMQWLEESEHGLPAQIERLEAALINIDELLRRNLSAKKYAKLIAAGKKYEADIEYYCDAIDYSIEQKSKIIKEALNLADKQSIEDKADFYEAYSAALKTPIYDEMGNPTKEPFPGTSSIYTLMVLFWRHVNNFPTMKYLHDWLCGLLGESVIGPYDNGRVKGICKRFKIRLAPRGRPKK